MDDGEQDFFRRSVAVSNVDKVFFPDESATKGDLLDYYARAAELLTAHADGRPVAIVRHPDGIDRQGFFQKNAGSHYPDWIHREDVPKREGGALDHVVLDEPATVVYLADQGAVEFHPWLATAADLEHPVEWSSTSTRPTGRSGRCRLGCHHRPPTAGGSHATA